MTLIRRLFLVAVAVGLLAPVEAGAINEWDQTQVTAITADLVKATKALYDAFYKQPPATVGTGQESSYYRLKQMVRRVRLEAKHLAKELENGKGHDETLPTYENLMNLVRAAQGEARRVFLGGPFAERALATRALLDQLAPYYDAKSQLLPPVMPTPPEG